MCAFYNIQAFDEPPGSQICPELQSSRSKKSPISRKLTQLGIKKKKKKKPETRFKGISLSFLSFFLFLIFHYFPFSITHSFSSFGLLLSVSERDIHVPETQKPHPLTVQTFFLVRSSLSEKSRLKGRVAFKGEQLNELVSGRKLIELLIKGLI